MKYTVKRKRGRDWPKSSKKNRLLIDLASLPVFAYTNSYITNQCKQANPVAVVVAQLAEQLFADTRGLQFESCHQQKITYTALKNKQTQLTQNYWTACGGPNEAVHFFWMSMGLPH